MPCKGFGEDDPPRAPKTSSPPMLDHATERDRCLAIFAKHRAERV